MATVAAALFCFATSSSPPPTRAAASATLGGADSVADDLAGVRNLHSRKAFGAVDGEWHPRADAASSRPDLVSLGVDRREFGDGAVGEAGAGQARSDQGQHLAGATPRLAPTPTVRLGGRSTTDGLERSGSSRSDDDDYGGVAPP